MHYEENTRVDPGPAPTPSTTAAPTPASTTAAPTPASTTAAPTPASTTAAPTPASTPAPTPAPTPAHQCVNESAALEPDQCQALKDFYDAANGPYWNDFHYHKQFLHNPCWVNMSAFVQCSSDNKQIIGLTPSKVAHPAVGGTLSPSIGNLTALEVFIFFNNGLTGSIPDAFTSLTKLNTLQLDGNHFTGSLPDLAFSKFTAAYSCDLLGSTFDCPHPAGADQHCNISACATAAPTPAVTPAPTPVPTPAPTGPAPAASINPFPDKVIWSYLGNVKWEPTTVDVSNLTAAVLDQKINYLVLAFVEAAVNASGDVVLDFPVDKYPNNTFIGPALYELHDTHNITISVSIGGADETNIAGLADADKFADAFVSFRQQHTFIDGFDFDIESNQMNAAVLTQIHAAAAAIKARDSKYTVTAAPETSQLWPGCGAAMDPSFSGGYDYHNFDFTNFDGLMIQWYEFGCAAHNSGGCPLNAQGIVNYYIALGNLTDKSQYHIDSPNPSWATTAKTGINNPPIVGSCDLLPVPYPNGPSSYIQDCSSATTCSALPVEKLAIGIVTYGVQKQAWQFDEGRALYDEITHAVTLLKNADIPFLGIASWQLNDIYSVPSSFKMDKVMPDTWNIITSS